MERHALIGSIFFSSQIRDRGHSQGRPLVYFPRRAVVVIGGEFMALSAPCCCGERQEIAKSDITFLHGWGGGKRPPFPSERETGGRKT